MYYLGRDALRRWHGLDAPSRGPISHSYEVSQQDNMDVVYLEDTNLPFSERGGEGRSI